MRSLIKLIDPKTLTAGIVPVLFGSIYSLYRYRTLNLFDMILLTIGIILIQSAANMLNDLYDFHRGTDNQDKAHEKVLASGEMTGKQVVSIIGLFLTIDLGIALYYSLGHSWLILLVAVMGGLVMYLYSSGPFPISRSPFGEPVAGITMGMGITGTVIYIQSGILDLESILVCLPTTLYIGTILLTNNLSDHKEDKTDGRRTLPILMGTQASEKLWQGACFTLLILTLVFILLGYWPLWTFIAYLTFPYKKVINFSQLEKSAANKGRLMGTISLVGLRYHLGILLGLLLGTL